MSQGKRYEFEGAQRTVAEIRAMVPALSESTIRENLKAGMTTRTEMLARPKLKCHSGKGWQANGCRMGFRVGGRAA